MWKRIAVPAKIDPGSASDAPGIPKRVVCEVPSSKEGASQLEATVFRIPPHKT